MPAKYLLLSLLGAIQKVHSLETSRPATHTLKKGSSRLMTRTLNKKSEGEKIEKNSYVLQTQHKISIFFTQLFKKR